MDLSADAVVDEIVRGDFTCDGEVSSYTCTYTDSGAFIEDPSYFEISMVHPKVDSIIVYQARLNPGNKPIIKDQSFNVMAGELTRVELIVNQDPSSADYESIKALGFEILEDPIHGSIFNQYNAEGYFDYAIDELDDLPEYDAIKVRVWNKFGYSEVAEIRLNITDVPNPIELSEVETFNLKVEHNSSIRIDITGATDFTITQQPSNGNLSVINSDTGQFTFEPNKEWGDSSTARFSALLQTGEPANGAIRFETFETIGWEDWCRRDTNYRYQSSYYNTSNYKYARKICYHDPNTKAGELILKLEQVGEYSYQGNSDRTYSPIVKLYDEQGRLELLTGTAVFRDGKPAGTLEYYEYIGETDEVSKSVIMPKGYAGYIASGTDTLGGTRSLLIANGGGDAIRKCPKPATQDDYDFTRSDFPGQYWYYCTYNEVWSYYPSYIRNEVVDVMWFDPDPITGEISW